jgi:hypothetical protein
VVRHNFQVCPVWIYTQSNITSITGSVFQNGSCKTLKYKVYNCIYSVRAVFTYWYMDIYDIPEKLWDYRIHDGIYIYKDTKS